MVITTTSADPQAIITALRRYRALARKRIDGHNNQSHATAYMRYWRANNRAAYNTYHRRYRAYRALGKQRG
jgi:hypothetical protein